jgi:hypothetical protein
MHANGGHYNHVRRKKRGADFVNIAAVLVFSFDFILMAMANKPLELGMLNLLRR